MWSAWRTDILKLSTETGKGPKELADAMYSVAQAGLRGSDALEALKASAMASATGMGDTKTVADAVTSALNAYGPANLSAATATGVLVATVKNGKMQLDELAPIIGKLLPVSAQLGVSFGEVSGAVAAMSRLGMGARQTVSALRGVFMGFPSGNREISEVTFPNRVYRKAAYTHTEDNVRYEAAELPDKAEPEWEEYEDTGNYNAEITADWPASSGGGSTALRITAGDANAASRKWRRTAGAANDAVIASFSAVSIYANQYIYLGIAHG